MKLQKGSGSLHSGPMVGSKAFLTLFSSAGQPQLAGTLYKMGRRLKGWHERYYELKGTELLCYKDATVSFLFYFGGGGGGFFS